MELVGLSTDRAVRPHEPMVAMGFKTRSFSACSFVRNSRGRNFIGLPVGFYTLFFKTEIKLRGHCEFDSIVFY